MNRSSFHRHAANSIFVLLAVLALSFDSAHAINPPPDDGKLRIICFDF